MSHITIQPTTLFPLWNYDDNGRCTGKAVTPLGFTANQNRMALPTWSYAMEKYPPKQIVEIGSYNGGFTCALGVHAWNIGANVYSMEVSEAPQVKYAGLAQLLGINWIRENCFSETGSSIIRDLIQLPGVTYLLCDGGDKNREINLFAPMLKSGDVIGGHDYFAERHDWWGWQETRKDAVEKVLAEHNFEPFMQEYFDVAAWLVYRKK